MSMPVYAEQAISPPPALMAVSLQRSDRHLVADSFAVISPAMHLFVDVFSRRLFEIAPEMRAIFDGDEAGQRERMVTMLRLGISSLNRLDDILPTLRLLGARHRALGVEPQHYGLVAEALLWTLDKTLAERFTPEVRDAWVAVCTLFAEVMTEQG